MIYVYLNKKNSQYVTLTYSVKLHIHPQVRFIYLFTYTKFVNNLEILEITDCIAHGLYCIRTFRTTLSFYLITFIFTYLSII